MFDFSNTKTYNALDETVLPVQSKDPQFLSKVLDSIDTAKYSFYDELSDFDKKQVQPYTLLRWISSIDDSMFVWFKPAVIENVFGKWKSGGKEKLQEFREALNLEFPNTCININKYAHSDRDWRIKFSVPNKNAAKILNTALAEFGISAGTIDASISPEIAKYQLILLNDMVNVNFWDMQNHPEMIFSLLCSVQEMVTQTPMKRTWLPFCKGLKSVNSELYQIFKSTLPELSACQLNLSEYKILVKEYSAVEFDSVLAELAYEPKERTKLLKVLKTEKERYGYPI